MRMLIYNKQFIIQYARYEHKSKVCLFLFSSPWRWLHEWPKHVGGSYVIKLHSQIQVHLLVFLNKRYASRDLFRFMTNLGIWNRTVVTI